MWEATKIAFGWYRLMFRMVKDCALGRDELEGQEWPDTTPHSSTRA